MFSAGRTTTLLLTLLVLAAQAIDNSSVASNHTEVSLASGLPDNLTCSLQTPTDYGDKSKLEPAIYDFCHRFDQRHTMTRYNLVWQKTDVWIGFDHLTLEITNNWCDMVQLDYPSCLGVFMSNILPSCSLKGGILVSRCGFWVIAPDSQVAWPFASEDMALAKVNELARREAAGPDTSASTHEHENSNEDGLDLQRGVIQAQDSQVDNAALDYYCYSSGTTATSLRQLYNWSNQFCSTVGDQLIPPGSTGSYVFGDDILAADFWIANDKSCPNDISYPSQECTPKMNSLLELCFHDPPQEGARGGESKCSGCATFGFRVHPADTTFGSRPSTSGVATIDTTTSSSLADITPSSTSLASISATSVTISSSDITSTTTESIASTSSASSSSSLVSSVTTSSTVPSSTTVNETLSTSALASSSTRSTPVMNTVDSASASHLMSLASQASKMV